MQLFWSIVNGGSEFGTYFSPHTTQGKIEGCVKKDPYEQKICFIYKKKHENFKSLLKCDQQIWGMMFAH